MVNKTKKGFTIVELVIVIAVIAILAAVLIPTFSNLINKANESADTMLVKNLNTALSVDAEKHTTMSAALNAALVNGGYDVATITTKNKDTKILWDSKNDLFVYLKGTEVKYIPESTKTAGFEKAENWELFEICDEVPALDDQTYSIYLTGTTYAKSVTVKVGFDAGENKNIPSVTYDRSTVQNATAQDVIIRTNEGILAVNAPLDTVTHYNLANVVKIESIANQSYHEFGKIIREISIKEGHLVLEQGSDAMFVNINATGAEDLANISVTLKPGSSYSYVTATNEALTSQALRVIENKTNETIKTLVKIDDSAVAFIKYGTEVTSYSDIKSALSDFQNKEGATLELLDNIVNNDSTASNVIRISMPANGIINGNGKMIYGNVAVHVNVAGGSIYNTQFKYIHNNQQASQDECDWYGWVSKEGKLTAIYASGLTGKLVVDGCLFDNMDWECIQTTPKKGAILEITNNVFMHSDKTAYSQLRYIHIQATSSYTSATVTITGNKFYKTKDSLANAITNIGCWYVSPTESSDFTGNYFEYAGGTIETNSELQASDYSTNNISLLLPALATPDATIANLNPVCYSGDILFNNTLQDAINSGKTSIYLSKDNSESVTISAGNTVTIYTNGYKLNGNVTNNGTLKFTLGSDLGGNATIVNNGSLVFKCNAAAGFTVTGSGEVSIESGATYDLSRISGNVSIKGGTFTTKPDQSQIVAGYIAIESENSTYKVSKMTFEQAAAAGYCVADYSSYSAANYYQTIQGAIDKGETTLYLIKDITENFVLNSNLTIYDKGYSISGQITNNGVLNFTSSCTGTHSFSFTNGENLKIDGGKYTFDPQNYLSEFMTTDNDNNVWTVRKKTNEELAAEGYVARNSTSYYKSVNDAIQKGATHLITNVANVTIEKSSMIDLYCDDYTFTGSIECTEKTLWLNNGTAIVSYVDCGELKAGYFNNSANITIHDGTATSITVAKNTTLVINGGTYTGTITVKSGGNASLIIYGGTFSVDPSAYVAEGYRADSNDDRTWTVVSANS